MWDVLSGVAEVAWDVLSGAAKMAWDVLSGVTKTAWDVLSGVANLCGMFCPGWQKMAWDVLSRDVLSYIRLPSVTVYFTYTCMLLKLQAQLMIIINSHSKRRRIIICIKDKNDYHIRTRMQGCIDGWSMCIC